MLAFHAFHAIIGRPHSPPADVMHLRVRKGRVLSLELYYYYSDVDMNKKVLWDNE